MHFSFLGRVGQDEFHATPSSGLPTRNAQGELLPRIRGEAEAPQVGGPLI